MGTEETLDLRYRRGAAAWPDFEVSKEQFAAFVERSEGDGPFRDADIYLAAACVAGDPRALMRFERDIVEPAVTTAAKRAGVADPSDTRQEVFAWAVLGDDTRGPGLHGYRGRGKLENWFRVVVLRRLQRGLAEDWATPDELADGGDLAAASELAEYEPKIVSAMQVALARLDRRDRNMLRHYFADGLTIEKIAAIYHLPRSTAARHLVKARTRLSEHTEAQLRAELGVADTTLRSILMAARSRLNFSVRQLWSR